mmetsp:Transcript_24210/g.50741  ORF Transcript_24210/g.50741 Transcript_24210/m.50741 type:complete len:421 (+) Transcript_24210:220-1482(+)
MSSREEFTVVISSGQQSSRRQAKGGASPSRSRLPHAPKPMEQTPLLAAPMVPPMPQSTLPPSSKSKNRGHGRSRSDYVMAPPIHSPDPRGPHPLNKGILSAPINNRPNRPPRGTSGGMMVPPHPTNAVSPMSYGSAIKMDGGKASSSRRGNAHRRAKSDIPLALYGGGSGGSVTGRSITKTDLLKSLPAPRWGGATPKNNAISHQRSRSRTGSDGLFDDARSVASGGALSVSGYGSFKSDTDLSRDHPLKQSIGNVDVGPRSGANHYRRGSDHSVVSVTTNLDKSSLLKGVTDTGRVQLQLPKDSFRLLMDSQLETGSVYKRKLVEDESEFFVDFHTVDDNPDPELGGEKKTLPPDMYVMAVDSSIYRRMMDEVIRSRSMPCGTFFCGHHEDVSHPDITIAALIVGAVVLLLLTATMMFS